MSSDEIAIRVRDVSKHYLLFDRPQDRLKQSIVPRLQRIAGRPPKRYYRDFAALSHVSFDIKRGETVGVIGRNGSGKSTLLQIVCGTLRPNAGTVEVNGRIAALLELGAGFNPEFTGRENVYLNAAILGLPRGEVDARFDDIARFADIGDFIEQPVKTYSSGMYVRLAFATAINVDPDILVVDEALAVGDEAFQRKCFARIEQIQDRGGTILFVSHAAQILVQLCTRAFLFEHGELILDGRPKFVTSQYHRLVNAGPEAAPDIRTAILDLRDAAQAVETSDARWAAQEQVILANGYDAAPNSAEGSYGVELITGNQVLMLDGSPADRATAERKHAAAVDALDTSAKVLVDFHDPDLKPQSTVYFAERGARIRDVRITTLGGEQVNVLQMGRRYIYSFFVDSLGSLSDLGFEMLFKTVSGNVIAGADTHRSRSLRLSSVPEGATIAVQFEFACILLPGAYFGSCGVLGECDGECGWLHKVVEGVMFRVSPEADEIGIGYVSIGANVSTKVCL